MKCQWLFVAALAAAVALTRTGHADDKKDTKPEKALANYVHVVVFTVKKDAPKDAVSSAIADCHELLANIPSVRGLKVGRPAEKATPNVAKKDYDFALVVQFENADGLMTYLEHPQHKKFLEKHGKHFDLEKLQVFDFSDEKR
jgi:hypothetical protein